MASSIEKTSETKMTTLIEYHHKTKDMALFESDGNYWIGSYSPWMTHQNGEPLYCFVNGYFETVEDEIRRDYFPYWQKRMIDKFGEEYYNANYCFEDCLNDWIVGNWAWSVDGK